MKSLCINDENSLKPTLVKAVLTLKSGGIVMHPTETCYGFAVDVFNESTLKKLYRLKGRDFDKPVSILVSDFEIAKKYGEFSNKALEIAKKYWPGPLSLVLPRKASLPAFLNSGTSGISIRVSDNEFCLGLIREFGGPVSTTSANIAGKKPLYEAGSEAVLAHFGELAEEIDLIVDGGELKEEKPSTVVRVFGDKLEVLRQGSVKVEDF